MTDLILWGMVLALLVLMAAVLRVDRFVNRIMRFQRRRTKGITLVSVLTGAERQSRKKYHVPLADIRDFVVTLQLGTSLQETLTGALAHSAEIFADRGDLGERLRRHVDSRLGVSPEAVLEGLANDLDTKQMDEVLNRIRMASEGGVTYNQVLKVSVDAIEEDMRADVERAIQQAPIALTVPMVAGVFLPALVLGLVPIVLSGLMQMRAP